MDSDESNMVDFYEFASAFYPEMDEEDVGKAMKELQPHLQEGVVQGHMASLDDEHGACRRVLHSQSTMPSLAQQEGEAVLAKAMKNVRAMGASSASSGNGAAGAGAGSGGTSAPGGGGGGGAADDRMARIEESLGSVVEMQAALMRQIGEMRRSMEAMQHHAHLHHSGHNPLAA